MAVLLPTRLELVMAGTSPPVRYVLDSDAPQLIGRSRRCQIRLPEEVRHVSRVHAQLQFQDGGWQLIDLSTLGTTLEGERVGKEHPVRINHGDSLGIGSCVFVARLLDAHDDSLGSDGSYSVSLERVATLDELGEANVDTTRLLRSTLELPAKLGMCHSEREMLEAACRYLVDGLAPTIASAYVAVPGSGPEGPVILALAKRTATPSTPPDVFEPVVSTRVSARVSESPSSVLFVQRTVADASLDMTVGVSTHTLGACFLERDANGLPTVIYTVGDRPFLDGQRWAARYLRLVATLVQQQLAARRRSLLAKYFSPKVVELLLSHGGPAAAAGEPKVVTATSLFFDVRGSSLPLHASADQLASAYSDLRRIIDRVTDCVFEFEGTIIDYAGDGVFAAWGAPFAQPTQASLAVACAVRLAQLLKREDFPSLGANGGALFGIGIAKGQVLAGTMGASGLFKYGIMGPAVSAAQRVETLTKPDKLGRPIIVTAEVRSGLADTEFACESLGTADLPGVGCEELYAVQAAHAPASSRPTRSDD